MNRRGVLTAAGTALPLVGGCLASSPRRSGQTAPSGNSPGDVGGTTTSGGETEERTPGTVPRGPARGQSDVEIEVEEVEDDDDVEYVDGNHTVRYVAGWRHANHEEVKEGAPPVREPVYDTTPFERWGETQCLWMAARTAAEHVNEVHGTEDATHGITSRVPGEDRAAIVTVGVLLDEDGEVVDGAEITFEELIRTTPASVDVTYRVDEEEYRMEPPVFARFEVYRLD